MRDAGDQQGISDAGNDSQPQQHDEGGFEFFQHGGLLLSQVQPDQYQVDGLDADERHDQAAEAVDQQVAIQDGGGAERAVGNAFQRQRDQRDDDQRVEITADRMALAGVARPITLSAPSAG